MASLLDNIGSFIHNRIATPIGQNFSNLGSMVHNNLQNNLQVRPGSLTYSALEPVTNFQNAIESPKPMAIPHFFNPSQNASLPIKVGSFLGNLPEDVVNSVVSPVGSSLFKDLPRVVAGTLGSSGIGNHHNPPKYNQLSSPISKLALDMLPPISDKVIGPGAGNFARKQLGIPNTPQSTIGDIAGTLEPIASVYSGGKIFGFGKDAAASAGKQILMNTLKREATLGGKLGGIYGLLNGLAQGRNDSLPNQIIEGLKQGVGGAASGLLLGGLTGAGGYTFGAIRNKLTDMLVKDHGFNPQQARDELGRFAKYEAKNISTGQKNAQEPTYYGDIRESLGLPRNGNYPQPPQPGLSIKYTNNPLESANKSNFSVKGSTIKSSTQTPPTFDQTSKNFGQQLRTYFTGLRDSSVAETNQLRDKIANIIKNPQDQEALTLYREFKNKPNELKQFLSGEHLTGTP